MDPDKVGKIEPNLPTDATESDAHRFEFGNNNAAYIETPRTKELQKMSKENLIAMVEILQAQLKKREELTQQQGKDITVLKGENKDEDFRDDEKPDYASNYSSDDTEKESIDMSKKGAWPTIPDNSQTTETPVTPIPKLEPLQNIPDKITGYGDSEEPKMNQRRTINLDEINAKLKNE
jgi:hypothetical protein